MQSLLFYMNHMSQQWDFQVNDKSGAQSQQPPKKHFFATLEANKKRSSPKFMAQLELIHQVRLTETFEPLDTMTISDELVRDGEKFFELCENCVGTNFMRVPLSF